MKAVHLAFFTLLSLPAFAQDSLSHERAIDLLTLVHDTISYHHPAAQSLEEEAKLTTALNKSKAYVNKAVNPTTDSVGVQDFILGAAEMQRAIQCGHLTLTPDRTKKWLDSRDSRARFKLFITSGGQYVLLDTLETKTRMLVAGTAILAMNDRPVNEIVEELAAFRGLNDGGYEEAGRFLTARSVSALYESRYGDRDSIKLTYRDLVTEEVKDVHLIMQLSEEADSVKTPKAPVKKIRKKERWRNLAASRFQLSKAEDGDYWTLAIRSFNNKYYRKPSFEKLLKQTFKKLEDEGATKLIVDLRYNGGGAINNAKALTSYFLDESFDFTDKVISTTPTAPGTGFIGKLGMRTWGGVKERDGVYYFGAAEKIGKPSKHRFAGEAVFVINQGSFSATTLAINTLQEYGFKNVIGQRTGGGKNVLYGGNIREINIGDDQGLKFDLRLPNWAFYPYKSRPGTVTPMELVPITQQDIIDGINPNFERAKEILGVIPTENN